MAAKVQHLTPTAREAIANRKPYRGEDDPFTIGYRSAGGTYMIASKGKWNDSSRPRDLIAIVEMISGTRAIPCTPLVNPDFLAAVVAALVDGGDREVTVGGGNTIEEPAA